VPPLPVISGQQARRAFERLGWRLMRQKGSHMLLVRDGMPVNLAIPNHSELDRGTLRALIRKADLSVERFLEELIEV
jgi:predicted RNA binding protein YcfA (HicA-like mRNA interferase family)